MEFKTKQPIDIYLNQLVATLLLLSVFLFPQSLFRKLLGIPYVLFLPGYNLTAALFPRDPNQTEEEKNNDGKDENNGLSWLERIAFSFGLSLAVVPLIGLGLNYTPWGIRLIPVLVATYLFLSLTGIATVLYRRHLPKEERLTITFKYDLDTPASIALIISIVIVSSGIYYVTTTPRQGEQFTEFYILGPGGKMADYPTNLTVGQQGNVTIGIKNHEYEEVPYRVEVWPVNKTTTNKTVATLFWSKNITLPHWDKEKEAPQWEYNYTFTIHHNDTYKLTYLLYRLDTQDITMYQPGTVLKGNSAENHINASYRRLHLWVNVTSNQTTAQSVTVASSSLPCTFLRRSDQLSFSIGSIKDEKKGREGRDVSSLD